MTNAFDPTQYTPPFAGPPPSIEDISQGLGVLGGGAFPDSDALFNALPELSWRAISFPYEDLETEVRQDLVIHKFADRNGAHIEGTGRHPIQVIARIPFLNGLAAGPNEHWQRPLYPFTRDNLLRAVLQPGSGPLQHPELGTLTCKCEVMRWRLAAGVRSGVWCDVTWLESDDTADELNQNLAAPSPLAGMQAAASDLDLNLPSLDPRLVPQLPTFPMSFEDYVFAARGAIDQFTIMQKQYAGQIDNAIYQANALEFSLNSAGNDNAMNWPMIAACERLKASCYDQKATQLQQARPLGFSTLGKDSTLAQVAAGLGAPIGDIILLNPALLYHPIVPRETVVRYYLQAAA
jgi:hypothetical protein